MRVRYSCFSRAARRLIRQLSLSSVYPISQLGSVYFLVDQAALQQGAVRALRGNVSPLQDDDLVGVQHRADALRDDEAGAASQRTRPSPPGCVALGLHVDRAGAVVEDQDGRLGQQRPGDGDALLLPAG